MKQALNITISSKDVFSL